MSGEPGDLTDIVLEEVRNLCAQYSTTSPFPVKPLPSSRGASSSSSSTGLRQPLREYRTRPSASRSGSASGHHEPRKRPFDHEGEGGGDAKRGAPMTTTVTTPVLRYRFIEGVKARVLVRVNGFLPKEFIDRRLGFLQLLV